MIQSIGVHRVRCGSIFDKEVSALFDRKVDLFYADPPWGNGHYKLFQTKNAKDNNASKDGKNVSDMVVAILDLAARFTADDGVIIIKYGVGWRDWFLSVAADYLHHVRTIQNYYKTGSGPRLCEQHYFVTPNAPASHTSWVRSETEDHQDRVGTGTGYKGVYVPTFGSFAKKGGVAADPCCGLGVMARFACDFEMEFRGNELNEKRLNKTIARLQK